MSHTEHEPFPANVDGQAGDDCTRVSARIVAPAPVPDESTRVSLPARHQPPEPDESTRISLPTQHLQHPQHPQHVQHVADESTRISIPAQHLRRGSDESTRVTVPDGSVPLGRQPSIADESTRISIPAGGRSQVSPLADALDAGTMLAGQTHASLAAGGAWPNTGTGQPPGGRDAALALPVGFLLNEYRIDTVLGQGGFGITYLATDINLNARVAVKEYLPAEFARRAHDKTVLPRWPEDAAIYQSGLESFLVEARTLATFRHHNIVRVARFFEAYHTAYIVLEYERGKPLKEWWKARAGLQEPELLALLRPLLDGLALVHESGYLHRDIKPDNIYVRSDDGSLVLLDFGAARQQAANPNEMANALTPGYAPAEQYSGGRQGPCTDLYAFGATLYWMVAGSKPPPAPERQAALAAGESDPMLPVEQVGQGRFSPEFLRGVAWALECRPEDRPQSIPEFCGVLFAAHAGSLGLQEALRVGAGGGAVGGGAALESWRALLDSPRLLRRHVVRLGQALLRPGSWPLVAKMTLAMVLTALLPMLITAYYNWDGSVKAVSSGELRNLERLAQSTAGRVSQLLADSGNLASYLGGDPDFVAYLRKPTEAGKAVVADRIANLVKTNPDVHLLILMDSGGTALLSNDPGVTGRNFKFREYFREAMAGRRFMTGMVIGATQGLPGVYYSHPVFDPSRKVVGVVVMRIRGATIAHLVNDGTWGNGRAPFMVDGDGVLIHHADPKMLYRSLAPLKPAQLRQIQADRRFGPNRIDSLDMPDLAAAMVGAAKPGNISYRSTLSGVDEHAGYAPVAGHNWVVGVTESRENFERPLRQLFLNVLQSVVLVGLVFLVVAVLFGRSIVRPVLRLTEAANALKEGDYDKAHIRVGSDDEIGRLARTFNVMIDVLRQREREREGRQPGRAAGGKHGE